jgi:hypothetical protein
LALALLLIKPQYLALPVLVLLLHRRWRALAALTAMGLGLLVISLALVGWEGLLNYAQLTLGTLSWQDSFSVSPQRMHTWRGFLQLMLQTDDAAAVQTAWLAGAALAALVALASWRTRWNPASPRFDLQWALLAVAIPFVSPYANFHDLSLLVVAGVLVARSARQTWIAALPIVGYLSMVGTELSGPIWHLQLSVLFLAAAIALLGWSLLIGSASRLEVFAEISSLSRRALAVEPRAKDSRSAVGEHFVQAGRTAHDLQ